MPSHPSLRIHSPRPDIEDVANHRVSFRVAERVCIRLSGLMLILSFFFVMLTSILHSVHTAVLAFAAMFLAYMFNSCAERLREGPALTASVEP